MPRRSIVKRIYRKLPLSIRRWPLVNRTKILAQSYLLSHDWVYDEAYYSDTVDGAATRSATKIAETILREYRPKCVVDVGCGTGALLEALRNSGCDVAGLEKSHAALTICRNRNLSVSEFDLEQDNLHVDGRYDVVISVEVAEHLPQSAAENYVSLLASLGDRIVFTAAPPGQDGTDHINEQPPEYWFEKFRRRGFEYDAEQTHKWQNEWAESGQVRSWYHRNLMLFERRRGGGSSKSI